MRRRPVKEELHLPLAPEMSRLLNKAAIQVQTIVLARLYREPRSHAMRTRYMCAVSHEAERTRCLSLEAPFETAWSLNFLRCRVVPPAAFGASTPTKFAYFSQDQRSVACGILVLL